MEMNSNLPAHGRVPAPAALFVQVMGVQKDFRARLNIQFNWRCSGIEIQPLDRMQRRSNRHKMRVAQKRMSVKIAYSSGLDYGAQCIRQSVEIALCD